jgi:hypothetical protein
MSHNPMGLHACYRDSFTFYLYHCLQMCFNWIQPPDSRSAYSSSALWFMQRWLPARILLLHSKKLSQLFQPPCFDHFHYTSIITWFMKFIKCPDLPISYTLWFLQFSKVFFFSGWFITPPVTVAVRSKTWTVFACSDAGILGSNPTQGMDVWCVYAFILCFCCPVFR